VKVVDLNLLLYAVNRDSAHADADFARFPMVRWHNPLTG
jgi:hypothetical protein